jgi:curved DNA-binding protein CbpA
MIKKIEDLNYYELLEVSPRATSQEIHRAYERVRRVYEPNSVALYSLFSPEETAAITQRIEEAYRTLVYEDNRKRYDAQLRGYDELPDLPPLPSVPKYQPAYVSPALKLPPDNRYRSAPEPPPIQQPPPPEPSQEPMTLAARFIAEFTGSAIKMLREQNNLSLRNIADTTKISIRYLGYIEEENFGRLPARAYIRGFIMLYAQVLGCEPDRVVSDYLKRYDAAMNPPKK